MNKIETKQIVIQCIKELIDGDIYNKYKGICFNLQQLLIKYRIYSTVCDAYIIGCTIPVIWKEKTNHPLIEHNAYPFSYFDRENNYSKWEGLSLAIRCEFLNWVLENDYVLDEYINVEEEV